MKKTILNLTCFMLVCMVLVGCSRKELSFHGIIKDFNVIEVKDNQGSTVKLDKNQTQEFLKMFKNIKLNKGKTWQNTSDYQYLVTFYKDKAKLNQFFILENNAIAFDNQIYELSVPIQPEVLKQFFAVTFKAVVSETGQSILVLPDKESNEYKSSDKIAVRINHAVIFDPYGNSLKAEDLKAGDIIEVSYNGIIMESYPAQIDAGRITVKNHDLVSGYFAVIDDIYKDDPGLNGDITMIVIDTSEMKNLGELEKQSLLLKINQAYGMDVIEGTFDELSEKGLINKKELYFEKGILISVTKPAYSEKNKKLTCEIKKWRSGLGAIGAEVTAEYKEGKWKISKENMWIS